MKVNEKFPNWMTSGGQTPESFTGFISNVVFPYFYAQDKPTFRYTYSDKLFPPVTVGTNAPWLSSLDVMFAMKFGERKLRAIVEPFTLHNKSTESVTVENITNTNILAQMINERFADKWNHIADALGIVYNPLENYNRLENSSFENGQKGDDYNTTKHGYSLSGDGSTANPYVETESKEIDKKSIKGGWDDADSRTVKTSGKYKKTTDTADSINGFNSAGTFNTPGTPSGFSKVTEEYDYTQGTPYKETNGGKIARDYHGIANDTNNPHYNEEYQKSGSEYTKNHIDHLNDGWNHSEISGNIGVTTSQQMLESELEVRKNLLYDIVLSDIAEFLTISVY